MATKRIVNLTDDMDGSPAVETVTFGLDGIEYEIDLSKSNAAKLRKAMGRYVDAARKVGGRRGRRGRVRAGRDREQLAAIREWAKQQGMTVSDRGRIPADVESDYNAAHLAP
jgi:hypothetical protein